MLKQLLIASCLMAVCVVIHAAGLASALWRLRRQPAAALQFWGLCSLFIRLAGWMILLHLGEIGIWGAIYGWRGAMGDMTSAFYFSAVTYTTTGYGDLLLPTEWRLVGAVEALTGILMCGWSTGFFFAVVSRVLEEKARPQSQHPDCAAGRAFDLQFVPRTPLLCSKPANRTPGVTPR